MGKSFQKRTVGAIVAVPLGDGTHTYAQILSEADCAFFDARTSAKLDAEDVASLPVLFRIPVMGSAVTSGRWRKVGRAPLRPELAEPAPTFIQDAGEPTRLMIYLGGTVRPASREECEGLERCAVWSAEHVEDRLRAHYKGVPDMWSESLRLSPAS